MSIQLQPGYKQTEAGVIPKDWSVINASEACSKIQDGTHFSPKISGNDYFYVTSKNIRFGYLDLSTANRIDAAQHQAIYKRCDVKKGDVLLTKDGANTGNAALNTLDEEFSLLSSVAFLRFQQSKHCGGYFLQQILSPSGQRQIQEAMAGNAITRLTLQKINKLCFPVPPTKAEQEAIAEALSDADALIESLEQLVAKKRHLKQGTMQELLTGKKRLPGFQVQSGYKKTELGVIPEDWETISIAKGCRKIIDYRGRTPRKLGMDWGGGDIPALSAGNVKMGYIDFDQECYFGSEALYKRWMTTGEAEKDDVVVTLEAPLGNVALIPDERKYILSQRTVLLQLDKKITASLFLFQVMLSERFQRLLSENATGSTAQGIQRKKFESLTYACPTIPEQEAIAGILSDMDAEITELETQLAKTRTLKQGMMHKLLTGEIRLL